MAAEAEACAKHITKQLQQRVVAQDGEAAECIEMVRKLGAPVDSLQVVFHSLGGHLAKFSGVAGSWQLGR